MTSSDHFRFPALSSARASIVYGPVEPAEERLKLTDHVDQSPAAFGVASVYPVVVVAALILTITFLTPLPESAEVPATFIVLDAAGELFAGEVIFTEGGVVSAAVVAAVVNDQVFVEVIALPARSFTPVVIVTV